MADQQSSVQPATAAREPAVASWVMVLAAAAAVAMGSQLRFPWLGGRLGLADAALGLALLALLADQFRRGVQYAYPRLLAVALGLYILAALLARPGTDGAVEIVQRFEQLFCGYLVWALLLRERRGWVVALVTAMLAASVVWAAVQARVYGFSSVLAPADILKLSWGVGGAYTGLFRSRMALSLFLGAGLVLVQPAWHAWAAGCLSRRLAVVVGSAAVLATMPHGFILLTTAVILLAGGLLAKTAWRNAAAIALTAAVLVVSGRMATVGTTLSPAQPASGELKSCHVDFIAAMRMAAMRPWTGVGAGTYQKYIGRCYGELPNPNVNDVETDSQSGLGILMGTVGYPAGVLLLMALLAAATRALAAFVAGNRAEPLLLGAAAALALFLVCLVVTDPFVRGPAWYLALGLAAAFIGGTSEAREMLGLGWGRVVLAGALVIAGAAVIVVLPSGDALARRPSASRPRPVTGSPAPATPAPAAQATTPAQGATPPAAGDSQDLFRVLNAAADAKTVTAPFEKAPDSQSAKGTVLRIPDKKGVPPEGQEPDMKYGGATYELQVASPVTCKVWVRAWWEGSCGNTVCVRMDDQGKILTVGNDGTYDAWHWLEVPTTFALEKGPHTLYVLNREDGIRIDQILVTNDMEYYPQGAEEE